MNREQGIGPDIGTALKDARRRIGMDVKEAEERTKIRAKYLRALEAEDWEVLPAPAYVRGFLRTYGALLGLDGEHLADEYRRRHEAPGAAASPASEAVLQERRRAGGPRAPSRGPLIAAVAGGIILLLVVLSLLGGGDDQGQPVDGASKGGGKHGSRKGDGKSKDKHGSGSAHEELVPVNVNIDPLEAVQVCLVGGSDALIDSQMLSAGASEKFSGEKHYRIDLQTPGTVKVAAGDASQRLETAEPASYEVDSTGIHQIEYAGPDCP